MEIYLDNAATTRTCQEAIDAMGHVLSFEYGNPSSLHARGRDAEKILSSSRETVASALGIKARDIFFTSGGTEANNWAIMGTAFKNRHKGKHIVSTAIEHDSILSPLSFLKQQGYDVTLVKPEKDGRITAKSIKDVLREDTILVSSMLVNNETGAILPIEEIGKTVMGNSNAIFHVDAVQGFMKIPFTAKSLNADLITVTAHKIHGPKGVGALYVKDNKCLSPIIRGGAQESGERGGTESLHNIAGFAAAIKAECDEMEKVAQEHIGFQNYIRDKLKEAIDNFFIFPMDMPNIMSISLPGYQSETILNFLDYNNVYVSRSSACKRNARSHVLEAMGLEPRIIDGTIRVSFSRYTTRAEIEEFVRLLILTHDSLFPKL